mgnify:CR=1 FL=1|jgi:hypothetical protein
MFLFFDIYIFRENIHLDCSGFMRLYLEYGLTVCSNDEVLSRP